MKPGGRASVPLGKLTVGDIPQDKEVPAERRRDVFQSMKRREVEGVAVLPESQCQGDGTLAPQQPGGQRSCRPPASGPPSSAGSYPRPQAPEERA